MIEFPNQEEIIRWGQTLAGDGTFPSLPAISDFWAKQMSSCMETTRLLANSSDDSYDICRCASVIFYKITKNHYLVDGNKRSAVICLYLFFAVNGMILEVPFTSLYGLSKDVAGDSREQIEVIDAIDDMIREHCMIDNG